MSIHVLIGHVWIRNYGRMTCWTFLLSLTQSNLVLTAIKTTLQKSSIEYAMAIQRSFVKFAEQIQFDVNKLELWAIDALKALAVVKA